MDELQIRLSRMGCRRCVRKVSGSLRDVPGVELITAHLDDGLVVIAGTMTREDVLAALAGSKYEAEIVDQSDQD